MDYRNGYAIQNVPQLGIGLLPLESGRIPDADDLLNEMQSDPRLTYGDKRYHRVASTPRFVPAHVAFDKVVSI